MLSLTLTIFLISGPDQLECRLLAHSYRVTERRVEVIADCRPDTVFTGDFEIAEGGL